MDLVCFLFPGWTPLIRPAEATRPWMDATPASFAYRCLPLNIANAHGWEILSPCAFEACWTGRPEVRDVVVRLPPGTPDAGAPVSIFGQGVLSFHVPGLFRTPPGWDLWVGGSPNRPKDGIFPLSGVIETDWSPYSFTMNWRFTRRNRWVRFAAGEPVGFIFPVRRGALERVEPKFAPIEEEPALAEQFQAWSRSRTAFQARMADGAPRPPTEMWQKRYYRGVDMADRVGAPDHRARLRVKPFVHAAPARDAPASLEVDAAGLAGAVVETAAALRDGADAAALVARLVALGLPERAAREVAALAEREWTARAPAGSRPGTAASPAAS